MAVAAERLSPKAMQPTNPENISRRLRICTVRRHIVATLCQVVGAKAADRDAPGRAGNAAGPRGSAGASRDGRLYWGACRPSGEGAGLSGLSGPLEGQEDIHHLLAVARLLHVDELT